MENKLKVIIEKLRQNAVEHREYNSGYIQACNDIMGEIEIYERSVKNEKN